MTVPTDSSSRTKSSSGTLSDSFRNAAKGIAVVFRTQRNARIHAAISVLVMGLAAVAGISTVDWAVLILTMGAVLAAEAMNTAIEFLTDLVSPDFHPAAGQIKDTAAAAVLILAAAAVVTGLLILVPPLLALL